MEPRSDIGPEMAEFLNLVKDEPYGPSLRRIAVLMSATKQADYKTVDNLNEKLRKAMQRKVSVLDEAAHNFIGKLQNGFGALAK